MFSLTVAYLPTVSQSSNCRLKIKSELLYNFRFTANQILASSPLRLTTRDIFYQLNPCGNIPYVLKMVKVKVTLRRAVYRQSVRLGVKPLETHDQNFFFN
jgi:hypothetical protein